MKTRLADWAKELLVQRVLENITVQNKDSNKLSISINDRDLLLDSVQEVLDKGYVIDEESRPTNDELLDMDKHFELKVDTNTEFGNVNVVDLNLLNSEIL